MCRSDIKHIGLLLLLLLTTAPFEAQNVQPKPDQKEARKWVYSGNKKYKEKKYKEAQQDYQNAVRADGHYSKAQYNLGNSLYSQKNFPVSRSAYEKATANESTERDLKAQAFHNIGNTYLEEKKYAEAIEAYKQSLRLEPASFNTKYNLAYAQKMLQNQGSSDNKDNKDKQDQNKDDQQNKDKKDQQKDQQDKKDQDKQQDQPGKQQPQPSKLSKEQAEAILNAMKQDEKKLQEKNGKEKGIPVRMEKDW